ncbi:MAG: EAL domain-containing protein [Pseudomonadales bacterium]|nr:EAL domain-containing protein [Pseudomonadales bacterium]
MQNTETNKLSSVEVQMRWHHPSLGDIKPELYVPLASKIGLGIELEKWCLRVAVSQAAI